MNEFRDVQPFTVKTVSAFVGGFTGKLCIDTGGLLTIDEARAFRDWLTTALPAVEAKL